MSFRVLFTLVVSWCGKLLKFSNFNRWHIFAVLAKKFHYGKISILEKSKIWILSTHCGNGPIQWVTNYVIWRQRTMWPSHANNDVIEWIPNPVWLILTVTKLFATRDKSCDYNPCHVIVCLLREFDSQSNYFKVHMTQISHMTCSFDSSII